MKSNKLKISCKRGFTLIELLVVVLIIGILAAVALPQYRVAVKKSRIKSLFPLLYAVDQAEQVYFLENGKYADVLADLSIEMPASQKENSTETRIYYEGFECFLNSRKTSIKCAGYKPYASIVLEKYFLRQDVPTGIICWVAKTNKEGNDICRSLKGGEADTGTTQLGYFL